MVGGVVWGGVWRRMVGEGCVRWNPQVFGMNVSEHIYMYMANNNVLLHIYNKYERRLKIYDIYVQSSF